MWVSSRTSNANPLARDYPLARARNCAQAGRNLASPGSTVGVLGEGTGILVETGELLRDGSRRRVFEQEARDPGDVSGYERMTDDPKPGHRRCGPRSSVQEFAQSLRGLGTAADLLHHGVQHGSTLAFFVPKPLDAGCDYRAHRRELAAFHRRLREGMVLVDKGNCRLDGHAGTVSRGHTDINDRCRVGVVVRTWRCSAVGWVAREQPRGTSGGSAGSLEHCESGGGRTFRPCPVQTHWIRTVRAPTSWRRSLGDCINFLRGHGPDWVQSSGRWAERGQRCDRHQVGMRQSGFPAKDGPGSCREGKTRARRSRVAENGVKSDRGCAPRLQSCSGHSTGARRFDASARQRVFHRASRLDCCRPRPVVRRAG